MPNKLICNASLVYMTQTEKHERTMKSKIKTTHNNTIFIINECVILN